MTREEAIANLNMISVAFVEPVTKEQRTLINDTFDMAISALSAEGEYIKKEDVINYLDDMPSELTEDGRRMVRQIHLKEFVADLPTYSFPDREKGENKKSTES